MDDYEEDALGLQQVDPSPVEETPIEMKDGYFPSTDGESNTTEPPRRTDALGLSHHSPIWYLTRIQKYSSYVFVGGFEAIPVTSIS